MLPSPPQPLLPFSMLRIFCYLQTARLSCLSVIRVAEPADFSGRSQAARWTHNISYIPTRDFQSPAAPTLPKKGKLCATKADARFTTLNA